MTPLFPDLPHPLGAYTLTRLLAVREESDVYAAAQGSVGREVALEVLHRGAKPEQQAAFLLTARARVSAANLPHVGQVYETLCADGLWFLTQELPAGRALSAVAEGETLSVAVAARIIAAAAELYDRCATAGIATLPLTADSVILNEQGKPCFLSPVIGKADERVDALVLMRSLAGMLDPLVPDAGVPGATRFATVLQWLREGYEGQMLTWAQIRETAETLRTQLGDVEPKAEEQPSEAGLQRRRRRRMKNLITAACCGVAGLALSTAIGSLGFLFRSTTTVPLPAVHAEGVTCRMADDSLAVVAAQPVTIADYAAFLHEWEKADEEEHARCLSGAPSTAALIPAAWEAQQKAKPTQPVTGVTYWQALAYARFRHAALPTAPALQTALAQLGGSSADEWTCDTFTGKSYGLIPATAPLAIRKESPFAPLPLPDREYASDSLGFRLLTPIAP